MTITRHFFTSRDSLEMFKPPEVSQFPGPGWSSCGERRPGQRLPAWSWPHPPWKRPKRQRYQWLPGRLSGRHWHGVAQRDLTVPHLSTGSTEIGRTWKIMENHSFHHFVAYLISRVSVNDIGIQNIWLSPPIRPPSGIIWVSSEPQSDKSDPRPAPVLGVTKRGAATTVVRPATRRPSAGRQKEPPST